MFNCYGGVCFSMRFIRRFGTYFPYSTNRVILEESMLISDVMYHTPGESGAFNYIEALEESMLISDVMYHTPGESGAFNYIEASDDLDCLTSIVSEPGAVSVDSLLVGTSVSFIQV